MKKILLLAVLCCIVQIGFAQKVAKGIVMDKNQNPLAGVTVVIKGTQQGTVTDAKGNFYLPKVSLQSTLVFSSLGYKAQEIMFIGQTDIPVILEVGNIEMEELVVLGYGTVKKSDLTGAVSVVKMDDISEQPVISAASALQGRIAGVQILQNTGEPGSGMTFNIRGVSSITGSSQPLVVIDGVPIESSFGSTQAGINQDWMNQRPASDALSNLNAADIASIQILKDASAIAIYGSRGANGVVLITTKSGETGKVKISYTHRSDFNIVPKKIKMASTSEYFHYLNEADINDGIPEEQRRFPNDQALADTITVSPNRFWQDMIFRTGYTQDHQLSVSGGTKATKYLVSGNYTDQNSIIRNSYFTRGGFRVNLDQKITPKLKMSVRSYMSMSKKNQLPQSNTHGNLSTSVILSALAFRPIEKLYDSEMSEFDVTSNDYANNPVLLVDRVKDETSMNTLVANLDLNYDILPGLTYQIRGGVNNVYTLREAYWPRGTFQGNTNNGSATRADNKNFSYTIDNLLTFNRKFRQVHNVNVVLGYSWQQWTIRASSQVSTDFPNDQLGGTNMGNATYPQKLYTTYKQRALSSFIGRANYSYKDRYVLVLTGRYDGSSRLASGHKWSFFPSIGGAWNIYNEPFMSAHLSTISNLRIRGSFGYSGNDNIAIGATQAQLGMNSAVIGGSIVTGFVPSTLESPLLKWERTMQANAGFDLGLFNRFSLTAEFYFKKTTDLLLNFKLPTSSGYGANVMNIGEIQNKGVDIELQGDVFVKQNFSWRLTGNLSINRNKVISVGDAGTIYGSQYLYNQSYGIRNSVHVSTPGLPVGVFWGYKTDGVFQNQDEINNYTYTDPNTGETVMIQPTARPGDTKYVDTNHDGKISDEDRTNIGNAYPKLTYGFGSDLTYKGFGLNFQFMGSYGNQMLNLNHAFMSSLRTATGTNIAHDAWVNRWHGEGTSNKYTAPTNRATDMRCKDWYVEDASYLRLQTVTLSYQFRKLPKKLGISSIKIFITGSNLFTITGYSGYDPAVNPFGDRPMEPGVDFGSYPLPATYSFGVNLTF